MYGETFGVDESLLARLGVHRISIPVPFTEAGGPVNACALLDEDGGWTLFDTGVGTPEGLAALEAGATACGVDLGRVKRIVVSHGHADHFGNAAVLAERSGARVFVHPADAAKVAGEEPYARMVRQHRDYFLRLGVPAEVLAELDRMLSASRSFARPIDRRRLISLRHGEQWRFRHFEATVLHTPGHTPGLVCLHSEAHRLLLADDHLLARVSPNPLLDLSQGEGDAKFLALVRYLESARAVHALELDCVVPGHGEPFRGHRALLDGLFEFYQRRQEKLLAHLVDAPATVYALLEVLFPRRDAMRLLLMLSEVLANVEVLEARGLVRRWLAGGVWTYRASERSTDPLPPS